MNNTTFNELLDFTTIREVQLCLAKLGKVISRQRIHLELEQMCIATMRLNRVNIYRLEDAVRYIQKKVKANEDNIKLIIYRIKQSNNS